MKKTAISLAFLCIAALALVFSSCGIISDLNGAVEYPESYSLTYEVTGEDGIITTLEKTVDGVGNVYYKDADSETVYIKDGSGYIKYEKSGDGRFEAVQGVKLTRKAVDEETSGINTYAEETLKKFMPTAKQEKDSEMLGRACEVYKIGVGDDKNSSYTYYYVDKETGICLGVETKNTALGIQVPHNGESFLCTSFLSDGIEDLSHLLEN